MRAVSEYVALRRASGSPFVSSATTLHAFCKHCGDVELWRVTTELISRFLHANETSQVTRVSKFSALKCFLNYYTVRGLLPAFPLTPPAKPKSYRAPFIYTPGQVRALLRATESCQTRATGLAGTTFRMLLLLLYSTGASVSEVLSVRSADIDVRRKQITFRATVSKPGRTLPIGSDLAYAVSQYLENGHPTIRLEALIFLTPLGGMLSRPNLCARFKRLRSIAGIEAESAECTPRLQDLRYTFAVHRLQSWIEAGTNLNELLPALSAYMGYASLTAAEQFLAYVPERFREDVQKLSPSKGVRRWSDDTVLMSFLTQL